MEDEPAIVGGGKSRWDVSIVREVNEVASMGSVIIVLSEYIEKE